MPRQTIVGNYRRRFADIQDSPAPTVADIGEFGLIARLTGARPAPADAVVGNGDDAAVLRAPDGRFVVSTDMLVQDRHFRLDWSSPKDVGHKAIAQNGADIAAMGARATAFVVALGCPADTPVRWLDELDAGMWDEVARCGGAIVGGDLVRADTLVISVTAFGDLDGRAPVLRSGARPGDALALAGRVGPSAAGYAALRAGVASPFVSAHLAPRPPYAAGPQAAAAGATAMTDVSDGLLSDAGHLATASGVAVDIDSAALGDPELAAAGDGWLGWVLTGGEDHALLATFPGVIPDGWRVIGSVATGSGVTVDGGAWQGATGWTSF